MPKYLEPAGDHLLVLDSKHETEIEGFTLPDNVRQQEMVFGTVISVGPEALAAQKNDIVCYGPYAGKNVVIEGTELRLLRVGQIEGYVRDEGFVGAHSEDDLTDMSFLVGVGFAIAGVCLPLLVLSIVVWAFSR